MKLNTSFYLKKPGYQRKSFSIMAKNPGEAWKKLDLVEVREVNDLYSKKKISLYEGEKIVKEVLRKLYQQREQLRPKVNERNLGFMESYFQWRYLSKHRRRRIHSSTPDGAYYDLKRAIDVIGNLDLEYTPAEVLQDRVDAFYDDRRGPHAKTVMRLNSMMRYIGRPTTDKLEKLPMEYEEVSNLTHDEFKKLLGFLDNAKYEATLVRIAYFAGLRVGEIFGLDKARVRPINGGFIISVNRQMYRDGTLGLPKRRKVRQAFGFVDSRNDIDIWNQVPEAVRKELRGRDFSKIVRKACRKARIPEITFHDLRHCYAINLLNRGVSISKVAMSLGDSEQVCKNSYVGHIISDEGMQFLGQAAISIPFT